MANANSSSRLANDFKMRLLWIGAAAFVTACLVALVLILTGPITLNIVFAAALGTLVSFALGGGLMAAVFYSDSSGYDQSATIVPLAAREEGATIKTGTSKHGS
jgi:hypothetical protein